MSETSLTIQIKGVDQATRVFKSIGSEAEVFTGRVTRVGQQIDKLNTSVDTNIRRIKDLNRHYRDVETTFRVSNYRFLKTLNVMQSIGGIGQSLVGMWQAYNIGQIRITQASRNVAETQKEVAKWQDIYNQYLRDFGADSAYTLDALDKLTQASEDNRQAIEDEGKAQRDMWAGYLSMGLQTVGVVADIASVATQIRILKTLANQAMGVSGVSGVLGLSSALSTLTTIGAITLPIALYVYWEWEHERLKKPPEGLTPTQETFYGTMPDVVKKQLILGERLGIPIPGGQLGIPRVERTGPHWLEKGESVLTPLQTRFLEGRKSIRATITQYNQISRDADFERANDEALKQFLRKIGNKW